MIYLHVIVLCFLWSCNTAEKFQSPSQTRIFPIDQTINYRIKPTINCDLAPSAPQIKTVHPITHENISLEYKDSQQIDYLRRGWEKRIPYTPNFFTPDNLFGYTPEEMKVTVIDIRNVNGKPAYHYYSNGTALQTVENLSATKFMGASFSVHKLRQKTEGKIGADIFYNSRHFVSDLDTIGHTSDNKSAAAAKMIGGNDHADNMLENWLLTGPRDPQVTGSARDYFGGVWGARGDYCGEDFDYPALEVKSFKTNEKVELGSRGESFGNWTHLSGLTLTEWMKRLVVNYRDPITMPKLVDYSSSQSTRAMLNSKPSWTKDDIKQLLYGSAAFTSEQFRARNMDGLDCKKSPSDNYTHHKGQPRGGMMWDGLRDWPQNAGGVDRLNQLFGHKWRTLGKAGSSYFHKKESAIGYLCLPHITQNGITKFSGRELIIHLHFTNFKNRPGQHYNHVHNAANAVIHQMVPGLVTGDELTEIGFQNHRITPPYATHTKKMCVVTLPTKHVKSLPIWQEKIPFRQKIGAYQDGETVLVLEDIEGVSKTERGYISGAYLTSCRPSPLL